MAKFPDIGSTLAGIRETMSALPQNIPPETWVPKSIPEYAFDTIREQVQDFEKELESVPGAFSVSLTSGGYAMAVESISLHGQFIAFVGRADDGSQLRVVQHYTQVSIVLTKAKPVSPKKPIGFYTD